jgi:hypothetical protein
MKKIKIMSMMIIENLMNFKLMASTYMIVKIIEKIINNIIRIEIYKILTKTFQII